METYLVMEPIPINDSICHAVILILEKHGIDYKFEPDHNRGKFSSK